MSLSGSNLVITLWFAQKQLDLLGVRKLVILTPDMAIGRTEMFNFILKNIMQDLNKVGILLPSSMPGAKINQIVQLMISELPLAEMPQGKEGDGDFFVKKFTFSLMVRSM
jgi:hypothetical protein